jgi:hypothetical protein
MSGVQHEVSLIIDGRDVGAAATYLSCKLGRGKGSLSLNLAGGYGEETALSLRHVGYGFHRNFNNFGGLSSIP